MVDRVFAVVMLVIIAVYGWIAFMVLKAPFQYDPLGPESWPRILTVVAALCCVYLIIRPDDEHFNAHGRTALNLVLMLGIVLVYAFLFQPAGFVIATAIFCTLSTLLLGGNVKSALLFGIATGVLGYLIGVKLLELNLPAGLLTHVGLV